jgi:hypothetical protein
MNETAVVFIFIFLVLMAIPCAGVAVIGYRLITRLGTFPSKTPALQMSVLLRLIVLEVVSFTLLLVFFKVLVAE